MSITRLLELASQLPEGLEADWDGTNHYEMHSRDDFWWLAIGELCTVYPQDNSEEGRRLGLVLDVAAALKGAESELRKKEAALPSERSGTLVEVYVSHGSAPFICGAHGHVTTEMLNEIELVVSDFDDEMFGHGEGRYVFRVTRDSGQYGDEGRCEIAPHFELELVQHAPCEPREMMDKRED